jgi:hypothetical protein
MPLPMPLLAPVTITERPATDVSIIKPHERLPKRKPAAEPARGAAAGLKASGY